MATLANFPMVSQLSNITSDGRASEDAQFECVPASIGAAILWYQGKTQWDQEVNPDRMKDAAYGEALRNSGTAAIKYVDFCKSLGIHLYAVENADYAHAIQAAHQHIRELKPVIFTRDDPYVDQSVHPDWTHVCCFFGEDGSGLTALDPYIGKAVYKTDAGWVNILRNSELWVAERISTVTIPANWKDDGTTLTAPNNVPVVHGFRLKVLEGWDAANWPLAAEFGTDQVEGSNQALGGGTEQIFRSSVLEWTKDRGVFEMWTGQELDYTRKQVAKYYNLAASAQAQVAQLQAQIAQLQQTNPDALNAIHQAQALFAPFK